MTSHFDGIEGFALSALLGKISKSEFFDNHFGKSPLLIERALTNHRIFDWDSLNSILNLQRSVPLNLKILKDGKETVPPDYLVALRDVRQGYTMFFEDVDRYDDRLTNFLKDFSTEFGCPSRFNLYLSSPGNQGRKIHFDTHDVFILQIEGEKKWELYAITDKNPIYARINHEAPPLDESNPPIEVILRKGDVLYVPRGYWHNVNPTDKISLHLTLGIFVPNGIEYLYWLTDECTELADARENLPLRPQFRTDSDYREARVRFFKRMTSLLGERGMSSNAFGEYEDFSVANLVNRKPFNFPFSLGQKEIDPSIRGLLRSSSQAYRLSREHRPEVGDVCALVFSKRRIVFPIDVFDLLTYCLDVKEFTIDELQTRFRTIDRGRIDEAVRVLLGEALVTQDCASSS